MIGARSQVEWPAVWGWLLAVLWVSASLSFSAVARAEPTRGACPPIRLPAEYTATTERAEALLEEGLSLWDAREHEAAKEQFREARRLFGCCHAFRPSPQLWYGQGVSDYYLDRHAEATRELVEACQTKNRCREDIERAIDWLRERVGEVQMLVVPAEAVVSVDGVRETLTSDGRLFVDKGRHVLKVSAEGYIAQERELWADNGKQYDEAIELKPEPPPPPPEVSDRAVVAMGRPYPRYRKTLLTLGVTVASAIAGTWLYRRANKEYASRLDACPVGCRNVPDDSHYRRLLLASRVTLGASVALAGGAAVLAWIESRAADATATGRSEKRRRVSVSPTELVIRF